MKDTRQFIFPFTLALLLSTTTPIFAQELSLSVNPSKIFIKQSLPIIREQTITITNSSSQEEILNIEKKSFTTDIDGKIKILDFKAGTTNLSENFLITSNGVQINSINLLPKQSKDINISLNLPNSIKKKDILFGILLRTKTTPKDQLPDNGISAMTQISAGIFIPLIISPTSDSPHILINNFTTDPFTTSSSPKFNITLENPTHSATSSTSRLKITNILGFEIENIYFTNKILTSISKYNLTLDSSKRKKIPFGIYKANLKVSSLGNPRSEEKVIYFFVLQLKKTLILLLSLLILVIIAIRVKRRRKGY